MRRAGKQNRIGGRPRKTSVSLSPAPLKGDHGTGTAAAIAGTVLTPLTDERGNNPNNIGRRRRENVLDTINLSMRQFQAGDEIARAWSAVEKLSSGGELKERVQSSPKPDETIDIQVEAMSRLEHAMRAVPSAMRYVVEHVCWHNLPLARLPDKSPHGNHSANLKVALDLVANKLRF